MRIKKQFFNEETLSQYGFKKENAWYIYKTPYCDIVILHNENIYTAEEINKIILWCENEGFIDDIVYRLIVDGLVEI